MAVTRPLAGTSTSMPLPRRTCWYGSRLETTNRRRVFESVLLEDAQALGGPQRIGRLAQAGFFFAVRARF